MTGSLSAFAAVQHVKKLVDSPITSLASSASSASSTASASLRSSIVGEEDVLPPVTHSSSELSERRSEIPLTPDCITALGCESVGVKLRKGENLAVVGIYSLWVKRGQVALYGAILEASSLSHNVLVPLTHAIPSITSASETAEIIISSNNNGIQRLADVACHFSGIWEPTLTNTQLSFHVLGYHTNVAGDVSPELRYLLLDGWMASIHSLLASEHSMTPKILVTGAQRSGKSTLCRCLINTILTTDMNVEEKRTKPLNNGVLLLDIDPGQPELAPPGIIYLAHVRTALLGPSFTNLVLPDGAHNRMIRMHYIGHVTPRESPEHYLRCVADLWSLYREYEDLPLVINTCGWITGAGKDILLSVVGGISLTNIIHLGNGRTSPWHGMACTDSKGQRKPVTLLPSQSHQGYLRSHRDLREMQMQAYIHALGVANGQIVWDQLPIVTSLGTAPATWHVLNETPIVVILDSDVVPELIADTLNGSVAAITIVKHGSSIHRPPSPSNALEETEVDGPEPMHIAYTPREGIPYLVHGGRSTTSMLDPATSECIGLGLLCETASEKSPIRVKSPVSSAHINAQFAKGNKIALVLARQQCQWASLEKIR